MLCTVSVFATQGLVARLNGDVFQVANTQSNYGWNTFCHYYAQTLESMTPMLTVACRSLGYEGFINHTGKAVGLCYYDSASLPFSAIQFIELIAEKFVFFI